MRPRATHARERHVWPNECQEVVQNKKKCHVQSAGHNYPPVAAILFGSRGFANYPPKKATPANKQPVLRLSVYPQQAPFTTISPICHLRTIPFPLRKQTVSPPISLRSQRLPPLSPARFPPRVPREDKPNAGYSGTPMWKIKAQLQERQASRVSR